MIEHCIAAAKKENEDKLLKAYVTDRLLDLVVITGKLGGADIDIPRYIELAEKRDEKPQKTAAQIIDNIKQTLKKYGGGPDGIDAV